MAPPAMPMVVRSRRHTLATLLLPTTLRRHRGTLFAKKDDQDTLR
jgi:hypothetical protein